MIRRLLPNSIQGRMLLLSAMAILSALGVAGWAIGGVLERVVTEGIDRRLDAQIALLASVVDADGQVDRAALAERSGALEAGRGWRWRIETPAGAIGSTDRPVLHGRPHPRHERGPEALDGADGAGRGIHARRLVIGRTTVTASVPRAVIDRPLEDVFWPLQLALAILALLLAAATWVQLRLGLKPLGRMQAQVAAIRAGAATRLDEDQPVELRGLAAELNALAADREAALATARQSAANLAHALKTPVATLALSVRDDPGRTAQVARINATIRHHLSRARAATTDARANTMVAPAVADLVQAIGRLHATRGLTIDTDIADVTAAIDAQDFDELLGNLLDNAARHAVTRVWVTARRQADARWLELCVADDGPGIPAAERDRVTHPGVRLDERGEGHGFGLAIVRELADLHGGRLTLAARQGGGLAACVTLPARHQMASGA